MLLQNKANPQFHETATFTGGFFIPFSDEKHPIKSYFAASQTAITTLIPLQMKPILLITALWLATQLPAFSQLIQKDDGKFYDNHNRLYTGTYIEYYPSGGKRIEINLLDGQKHGTTLLYFESQNVQEIRSYQHNEMDGNWITRNDKGVKIAEANYRNGLKHGKWYIWDDNGTKRYEMEYHEGKKTGKWYIWDEKGVLVNQKDYSAENITPKP
jgi:hypothetical protein